MIPDRNVAVKLTEELHICLVKSINAALTERVGEDWFDSFREYDSNQTIPVLDKNHTSVNRLDLQACLKFLRYRSDYAKIVFEYYGYNFYLETDDSRKAQLLLNQRLDNLIHNVRNYMFAHASAQMVEEGVDNSIRSTVYGVKEAVDDMLKLAGFFSDVKADDGESYYEKMKAMASPSGSYPIKAAISKENMDLSVGTFAEICNRIGIRVSTSKDGSMNFESGNYEGDIARIKLFVSQNMGSERKYGVAETIKREKIKLKTGDFVVACQKLGIPVVTDEKGVLSFSSANYSGDIARIKLGISDNKSKKKKRAAVVVAVIAVVVAAAVALSLAGVMATGLIGRIIGADKGNPDDGTGTALSENGEYTKEEVEGFAEELFADMRSARSTNDYEAFLKCYTDADESGIKEEYEGYKVVVTKSQFFVTYMAQVDKDAYAIDFIAAVPNGNNDIRYECRTYVMVNTTDGFKISGNMDLCKKAADSLIELYPDGYVSAKQDGNNAEEFFAENWLHLNTDAYVVGALDVYPRFIWQDDSGDVCVAFDVNNGTGVKQTLYNFEVEITDLSCGIVYDGTIKGEFSVDAGTNTLAILKISADKIYTGTEEWSGLNCKFGCDWK